MWIVMDMDGTLLNEQKKITEKTLEILLKAQELGYRLVLASGRPTSGMMEYAYELKMNEYHGLLISYNGSYVEDVSDHRVYFHKPIEAELCQRILHHLKNFDVHVMIDKDRYMFVEDVYATNVRHESKNVGHNLLCEVEDLEAFCDFPLNKIIVCGDADYLKDNYQLIAKPFQGLVHSMFTGDIYYEFNALDVNKYNAFKETLLLMNEDFDFIAFGDGHNDLELIEAATIGVAMGNACEKLKDIADYITDTNEEDGIAKALIHFLLELKKEKMKC